MRLCEICGADLPIEGGGITYISRQVLRSPDNRRDFYQPVICAACRTNSLIRWCLGDADHAPHGYVAEPEWAEDTSPRATFNCPDHSGEVRGSVQCASCDRVGLAPRSVFHDVDGNAYCDRCRVMRVNCSSCQSSKPRPLMEIHPTQARRPDQVYLDGPGASYYCNQACYDMKDIPHWLGVDKLEDFDFDPDCGCRGCMHLTSVDAVKWKPTKQLHRDVECWSCGYSVAKIYDVQNLSPDNISRYCHLCFDDMRAAQCDCGDYYANPDNRYPMCFRCLEDDPGWWKCEVQCGVWAAEGEECNCGGIHRYNYAPPAFTFFKSDSEKGDPDKVPYLGLELEVEVPVGMEDDLNRAQGASLLRGIPWAYPVHDGSLRGNRVGGDGGDYGFEIVTHPLSFDWLRTNWLEVKTLLEQLRGMGFRSWDGGRCGMHIHISRRPMTEAHQMKFITFIYGSSNLAMAIGQRGYRDPALKKYASFDSEDRSRLIRKVRNFENPGVDGHYAALNANKRNTLEARWFRGTLAPIAVMRNIEFIHSVWLFTKKYGHATANEINYINWLSGTPERRIYSTVREHIEKHYIARR